MPGRARGGRNDAGPAATPARARPAAEPARTTAARTRRLAAAATRLVAARRALDEARRTLARETAGGRDTRPVLVHRAWTRLERAGLAHAPRLLALPGVVGVGLDWRERRGVTDPRERCVVVYVHTKRPLSRLRRGARIPRTLPLDGGARVPIDVRAIGDVRRQLRGGTSLGPAGSTRTGTIGAFATDLASGRTVALTAMHVVVGDALDPVELPAADGTMPRIPLVAPTDDGIGPALGALLRGSLLAGTDAASVLVRPGRPTRPEIEELGRVRGWRPLGMPGDVRTAIAMRGAASARVQRGVIVAPSVRLSRLAADAFGLLDAFFADIDTEDGDSGAACIDNSQLVLGLLVGRTTQSDLAVFTPIATVLARLACDIPTLA
jgi:hypothetical protein